MSWKAFESDVYKLVVYLSAWTSIVGFLVPDHLNRLFGIACTGVVVTYAIFLLASTRAKGHGGAGDPPPLTPAQPSSPSTVVQPVGSASGANPPSGAPPFASGGGQAHWDLILVTTRRAMFGAFLGMGLGMGSYLALLTLERYTIVRPIYVVVVTGIAIGLTGMVGAFIAGTSVFVGALVYSYQKSADTRLAQITMFVLSGLAMAAGLALLSQGVPGNTNTTRAILARFVIGAGLLGSALLPMREQDIGRLKRTSVAIIAGFAVFGLIREMPGLVFFNMPILWQLIVGGGAAAGFTWGLDPSSWPRRWERATASPPGGTAAP